MILASVVQAKLNLVVLQVGGVPAGHSQGPCHGRVLDQAVWPAHLQGYDVIQIILQTKGLYLYYISNLIDLLSCLNLSDQTVMITFIGLLAF